jgi:hypothetical protein
MNITSTRKKSVLRENKKSRRYRKGDVMREMLESFDVLFLLMGLSCVSLVMKVISYILYHNLLWDSNQMGTTDNPWMKSMMSKFEAYYKLQISVHNVENFVDRYLYHYHFWGLSLETWENIGIYCSGGMVAGAGVMFLLAGYWQLPEQWFWAAGLVVALLLCVQGVAELFFDTRRCWKIFRIQMIDYMENTMRARLENEYFNRESTRQYQMEYFDLPVGQMETKKKEEERTEESKGGHESVAATVEPRKSEIPEFRELLNTFVAEMKLDQDIAGRQQMMTENSTRERAQLFEEILEEFM